ncbi:hypothetical protein AB3S75_033610 [Citrus x aurantiifolia]
MNNPLPRSLSLTLSPDAGSWAKNSKSLITNSSPLLLPQQSTVAQLPQQSAADVIFR